jgi:large subunit ribosomal protein L4
MTLTIDVVNPTDLKAAKRSIELPAEIFDVQANIPLMHQVVVAQLAAARQGTHSTKTRGEVRGGGKKPHRQKGTGRARQGSSRAPQFVGGGVVHGPQPRNYSQRTPKKMIAAALRGALSDRARNGRIHVVSSLVVGENPSTKHASAVLASISSNRKLLVVVERRDVLSWKCLRNVDEVHLIDPGQLNTYDVLVADDVVFTAAALEVFLAGPMIGKSSKASASSAEVADLTKLEALVEASTAPAASVPDSVGDAPYGKGSHASLGGGAQPEGFAIKGHADSVQYHLPGSASYDSVEADVWFATAADAEKAGFAVPSSPLNDAEKEDR